MGFFRRARAGLCSFDGSRFDGRRNPANSRFLAGAAEEFRQTTSWAPSGTGLGFAVLALTDNDVMTTIVRPTYSVYYPPGFLEGHGVAMVLETTGASSPMPTSTESRWARSING